MAGVFLAYDQPSWCYVPELAHLPKEQQMFISTPMKNGAYDTCKVYDLPWDSYSENDFAHWDRAKMTGNASEKTCKDH